MLSAPFQRQRQRLPWSRISILKSYKTHLPCPQVFPPALWTTRSWSRLQAYPVSTLTPSLRQEQEKFRVLFMGRDEFSCLVLEELYQARDVWKEIIIATQADAHVGRRGSVLSISPLKTLAENLGLPVYTIPKVKREFRTWELPPPFTLVTHSASAPDRPTPTNSHILITASFGRILTSKMLRSFLPGRRLNVHPSLLPAYRGPAPIQHTILNGDEQTGVCVIEMLKAEKKSDLKEGRNEEKGIDAGSVWGERRLAVPPNATFNDLRSELAVEGGKLLVSVLRDMKDGKAKSYPQALFISDHNENRSLPRAPFITAEDAHVDFHTMSAEEIERRFRAVGHQKPLFTYTPDGKHKLQLCSVCVAESSHPSVSPASASPSLDSILPLYIRQHLTLPGQMTFLKSKSPPDSMLLIRCAHGSILGVTKVKPEGKSERDAGEFWRGLRGKERFGDMKEEWVLLGQKDERDSPHAE